MATITCTIPSGNDYRHYLTTLAYLQDINDGMPQFFKDLLANQVELDKHIPQSLQRHPPQRNLELNAVFEFTSHKVSDPWRDIMHTHSTTAEIAREPPEMGSSRSSLS